MKTKTKVTRLVLAASLSSLIWAGCSTTDNRYAGSPASASTDEIYVDDSAISSAPINQLKFRPDTHPELRSGLWSFSLASGFAPHSVFESSTYQPTEPGESADTTALLPYNPSVINIATSGGTAPAPGTVVTEAAGAEPGMVIETPAPTGGRMVRIQRDFWLK
jgi:hypothetical protein